MFNPNTVPSTGAPKGSDPVSDTSSTGSTSGTPKATQKRPNPERFKELLGDGAKKGADDDEITVGEDGEVPTLFGLIGTSKTGKSTATSTVVKGTNIVEVDTTETTTPLTGDEGLLSKALAQGYSTKSGATREKGEVSTEDLLADLPASTETTELDQTTAKTTLLTKISKQGSSSTSLTAAEMSEDTDSIEGTKDILTEALSKTKGSDLRAFEKPKQAGLKVSGKAIESDLPEDTSTVGAILQGSHVNLNTQSITTKTDVDTTTKGASAPIVSAIETGSTKEKGKFDSTQDPNLQAAAKAFGSLQPLQSTDIATPKTSVSDQISTALKSMKIEDIKEMVSHFVDAVTTLTTANQTTTTVTLNMPNSVFNGATIQLTEFTSAPTEFNVTFANLTPDARRLIEMTDNQSVLRQNLIDRGYTLQTISIESDIQFSQGIDIATTGTESQRFNEEAGENKEGGEMGNEPQDQRFA